jgi:hypothetical protein
VVAGISTWTAELRPDITDWLARKVAVTDHLETVGAPVVGNSRELPPGPHERDGLAMTFTTWAPPDADRTPDAADCVAMLPDLHAALATYPVSCRCSRRCTRTSRAASLRWTATPMCSLRRSATGC